MFHIPCFYLPDCLISYYMHSFRTWIGSLVVTSSHSWFRISLDRRLLTCIWDSPYGLFTDSWSSNLHCVHPPLLLLPPRLSLLAHTLPSANTYAILYDSVIQMLATLKRYQPGALALIHDLSILYPSELITASLCLLPTPRALLLLLFLLLSVNLTLHSHSSLIISNDLIVQTTTCHGATKYLSISTLWISTYT